MSPHRIYRFGDFQVDPETWRFDRDGQEIHLEPTVLKLLIYLISQRDRLVSRQELMDAVWGDTVISESALSKAVARLRKALGEDSTAPRYLETVHTQGYRFIAEVEESEYAEGSIRPPAKSRIPLYVMGTSIVIFAVSWVFVSQQNSLQPDRIESLAVLPLSNLTGDPQKNYYADGLQDILITELSQIEGLRLTSRQSTKRYRDSQLPTSDIAGELGVDALVEGSLLRTGGDTEITIQLVHGQTDEHLWAERYTRDTRFMFDVLSEAAQAIAVGIDPNVWQRAGERHVPKPTGPIDPRAIDGYSLGLMHLDRFAPGEIQSAIEKFNEAIMIEPEFALAWGHLAVAHAMYSLYGYAPPRESIEKARAAALRAIEANDELSIGHSTLGWVRLWTGDQQGGCEAFQRALQLNPSAPYALHGDADCLMLAGRMDDSIVRTRELLMVGPFSAMHNRPLPYHLFLARRFDEAVVAAEAMQVRVPGFSMHWLVAQIYWQQGLFDEALEEERLELEWRNDTVLLRALEAEQARGGPEAALLAMAEALVARADERYVDPFRIGETFARAGHVDEALHWLGKAVDHGSFEITYLALRPDFDRLREDPRFQDLLDRVYTIRIQRRVDPA